MRLRFAAAAATLFVLIGLVVLALSSASAQTPPDDLTVTFDLVEDSDNIVAPGETIRPRLTFTHSYEFDPQGAPPPTLTIGPDSTLRIAGPFKWERRGRGSAAFPSTSLSGPRPLAIGSAGELSFSDHGSLFQAKALDGRTLATTNREGTNNVVVRVIDTSTMTLFDTVSLELGTDFARPASPRRFAVGSSVAVWQEDGVTAWIFIGSPGDRHSYRSLRDVGSVWIYKVDYSAVDADDRIVRAARLIPNEAELRNNRRHRPPTSTTGTDALYGSAVAVSADGGTLVVGAPRMNEIGAAYVYERPAAGWGALTYDDGIKLSPVEILNRSDGSHYEAELCNGQSPSDPAWPMDRRVRCTRWWSMDNSQYGSAVSLSADGGVIAVGAYGKDERYDTPARTTPGSFPGTGEVFVFVEPDGGWGSVAQANDGNPDRYGPSRRITRPDRILRAQVWGSGGGGDNYQHFGKSVSVSPSGAAIAVGAPGNGSTTQHAEPGKAHVFRMPTGGWRDATPYEYNTPSVSTNETTPDADLSTTVASSQQTALLFGSHVSWNGAGDRLYVSSPNYHYPAPDPNPRGRGFVFPNPVADADIDDAGVRTMELPKTTRNAEFGSGGYDIDGERLVLSAPRGGRDGLGEVYIYDSQLNLTDWTVCTERTADSTVTRTCVVEFDDTIVIAPGTHEGAFTLSATVDVRIGGFTAATFRESLELTVGTVDEAASAVLSFAENDQGTISTADDAPWPASLSAKGRVTTIQLAVLNEHGKAAAAGSVGSVLVTTNAGVLRTQFGGGCGGASFTGPACQIDVSAEHFHADSSDDIQIELVHDGKPGTALVRATVLTTDGETFTPEPLSVVLAGEAETLTIGAPPTAVLNVDTATAAADDDVLDDRDILTLRVSAVDENGVDAAVPDRAYHAIITGPNRERIDTDGDDAQIRVTWPVLADVGTCPADGAPPDYVGRQSPALRGTFQAYLRPPTAPGEIAPPPGFGSTYFRRLEGVNALCAWFGDPWGRRWYRYPGGTDFFINYGQVLWLASDLEMREGALLARVDVEAAADAPLPSGEYAIELRAGSLSATQTFSISGEPADIALSPDREGVIPPGSRLTVTATVADEQGAAVPDGTRVAWSDEPLVESAVLVQLSADARTTDGRATATYLAVAAGRAYVRASANAVSNVALVAVADAAASQASLADSLSATTPGAPTAWLGAGSVSASALLGALDGVGSIRLWQYGKWLRYGVVEGRVVPGSYDFTVQPGDVLWLGE